MSYSLPYFFSALLPFLSFFSPCSLSACYLENLGIAALGSLSQTIRENKSSRPQADEITGQSELK